MKKVNLVWLRNDLRIDDNSALYHAAQDKNCAVFALYFVCQKQWQEHWVGSNQQALIFAALSELKQQLRKLNIPLLILDAGHFSQVPELMQQVVTQLKVDDCYFNREILLNERERDKQVYNRLKDQVKFHSYNDQTLISPHKIVTKEQQGYKVFSDFARAVKSYLADYPLQNFSSPKAKEKSNFNFFDFTQLAEQQFVIDKASIIKKEHTVFSAPSLPEINEKKIHQQLERFCKSALSDYAEQRDYPAISGTSALSAALAVGSLSIKRCYTLAKQSVNERQSQTWINELIWRDFYRSVAWHFPHVVKGHAFNPVDKQLTWSNNTEHFAAWKNAQTGIPIIDAAITQLRQTGWMHNRLRMIVASYLTKNLWIDWREGERFFAEHLFDYDFASNNGGWQWCASVGTDAAPYFRVFNPASQQQKFDPDTSFIKQWLPALKAQPAKNIHKFETLSLPNYPSPQVNLKATRQQAIEAFKQAKG
ncbi:cryptochrome/photolyase family protein [Aliikangiella maris]|uniref:Deoxyribodipyrimidine photo-lyase n=2 Tax=Aliikangiella maris TaxID=3162458 RepID=A0ABV3MNK5_9GAMM